jgi:hypothetical protein
MTMGFREKIERIMMAITFAEAGEHDTAREMMRDSKQPRKRERKDQRPRPRLQAPSQRR